eukprot:tig00000605_g2503.t1
MGSGPPALAPAAAAPVLMVQQNIPRSSSTPYCVEQALDQPPSKLADVDLKAFAGAGHAGEHMHSRVAPRRSLAVASPIQVVFKDVRYSVKVAQRGVKGRVEKQILRGCTGVLQPGRLCGILGSSGAGKTTLLNLLAGQVDFAAGSVLLNGEPVTPSFMRRVSGFVFQDDVILETMTVREALAMSAQLRLPPEMSPAGRRARVDEILSVLHLEHAADTIVGSSTNKGISGGERKRAACGMEMIVNPGILFLDEPTSGLDTFTATSIMETLKGLAASGRTIAATLHQPSSEIFHMFDDLMIMAHGRILYFGPAAESVPHFAALGYPCPTYTNPADHFFMRLLNARPALPPAPGADVDLEAGEGAPRPPATPAPPGDTARVEALLDGWPQTALGAAMTKAAETPAAGGVRAGQVQQHARLATQFEVLTKRALRNVLRNKLILRAKLAQTLFMALLCGLIYLRVGTDQYSIQNRNGALFFITTSSVMSAIMGILSVFDAEKAVFRREHAQGMYGAGSFFLSRVAVDLPFQIALPWLFATVTYWMIGLQASTERYFVYSCVVVLMTLSGQALGIFIAAVSPQLELGLMAAPMLIMPLMIFSGFMVSNAGIPVYFDWIKYISPMKYGYEALLKNEYTGLTGLTCEPGKGACMARSGRGEEIITALGMDDGIVLGYCILALLGMTALFLGLAYAALLRVVRKPRA